MPLEAQTDGSVEPLLRDQGERFDRGVTVDADGGIFAHSAPERIDEANSDH